MGRPLKIQKQGYAGTPGDPVNAAYPQISTLTDPATPAGLTGNNFYGIVGGNVQNSQTNWPNGNATMANGSATFPVVAVTANVDGTQNEAAYITRQKGASKFLVTGTISGVTGLANLANVAAPGLTQGQMSVGVLIPNGTGGTNTVFMSRVNNKYGLSFNTAPLVSGVIVDNNATQFFLNFFEPTTVTQILAAPTVTGTTNPVFTTTTPTTISLQVGAPVVLSGVNAGVIITGYVNPTSYLISRVIAPNQFTLTTLAGAPLTVTGAPGTTGLTFTLSNPILSAVKSGSDVATFTNATGNITLALVPSLP